MLMEGSYFDRLDDDKKVRDFLEQSGVRGVFGTSFVILISIFYSLCMSNLNYILYIIYIIHT